MNRFVSVLVLSLLGFAVLVSFVNLNNYQKNIAHVRDRALTNRHLLNTEEGVSPVIAVFIHEQTRIDELCDTLKTLVNLQGSLEAPVLAFHLSTTPELADQNRLQLCTDRPVFFNTIDINSFPVGFEPVEGKDYAQAQINRFWTSGIWTHPALKSFDVIMRIDDTSCFSVKDETLPFFNTSTLKYSSQMFSGHVYSNVMHLKSMYEFTRDYTRKENLIPKHSALWQRIHYTFQAIRTVPNFQDSFEVIKKDFMLQDDVNRWLTALTEEYPYGYFTHDWNVNAERVLTMSIFGTKSSVDTSLVKGFVEKDLANGNSHKKICRDPFDKDTSAIE